MNQLVANRLIENETQGSYNANVRHKFNNEADFTAWLEMEKISWHGFTKMHIAESENIR